MILVFILSVIIYSCLLSLGYLVTTRSFMLSRYCDKQREMISEAIRLDEDSRIPWKWRYEAMKKVSFDQMTLKFWRTFDSFYPDKTFLEPLPEYAKEAYRVLEKSAERCRCNEGPGEGPEVPYCLVHRRLVSFTIAMPITTIPPVVYKLTIHRKQKTI